MYSITCNARIHIKTISHTNMKGSQVNITIVWSPLTLQSLYEYYIINIAIKIIPGHAPNIITPDATVQTFASDGKLCASEKNPAVCVKNRIKTATPSPQAPPVTLLTRAQYHNHSQRAEAEHNQHADSLSASVWCVRGSVPVVRTAHAMHQSSLHTFVCRRIPPRLMVRLRNIVRVHTVEK